MSEKSTSMRDVFRETVLELAEKNPDIFVLTADVGVSFGFPTMKERIPKQTVETGIAEQNMVGIATGLAHSGKIPFVFAHAFVLSMRALEQIRTDVCYSNANVKFVGYCGGVAGGVLGNTHHALEDIGILKSLPNMSIIVPADGKEMGKAVRAAVEHKGPVYMRIGRSNEPIIYQNDYNFEMGKAVTLREGKDISLIATGLVVSEALKAADELAEEGIDARVINIHTIKPLDRETVIRAAEETRGIVTVEEHNLWGGLGESVATVIAEEKCVPVKRIGIPDTFVVIGAHPEILERYGITASNIADKAREIVS
ncbi:transketolase family protein [Candidatus Aerophobetes bacterium]|nr:transketolase family protein [Candidatus Aerophobetes bacterium]